MNHLSMSGAPPSKTAMAPEQALPAVCPKRNGRLRHAFVRESCIFCYAPTPQSPSNLTVSTTEVRH
jgi:hypothetical protein